MKKEHFEILLEDMNTKFNIVLESHEALRSEIREAREESNSKHDHTSFLIQTLNQKIDTVESNLSARIDSVESSLSARIDSVEFNLAKKIDQVANDLSAHRTDTEAHHGIYCVKET
jgi:outer membrane murein-binding lipoprotein Lpp